MSGMWLPSLAVGRAGERESGRANPPSLSRRSSLQFHDAIDRRYVRPERRPPRFEAVDLRDVAHPAADQLDHFEYLLRGYAGVLRGVHVTLQMGRGVLERDAGRDDHQFLRLAVEQALLEVVLLGCVVVLLQRVGALQLRDKVV